MAHLWISIPNSGRWRGGLQQLLFCLHLSSSGTIPFIVFSMMGHFPRGPIICLRMPPCYVRLQYEQLHETYT
jgi:hypothetical protein